MTDTPTTSKASNQKANQTIGKVVILLLLGSIIVTGSWFVLSYRAGFFQSKISIAEKRVDAIAEGAKGWFQQAHTQLCQRCSSCALCLPPQKAEPTRAAKAKTAGTKAAGAKAAGAKATQVKAASAKVVVEKRSGDKVVGANKGALRGLSFPFRGQGWVCAPEQPPCAGGMGPVYAPQPKIWKVPPWREFKFSIEGGHRFQYCILSKGSGAQATLQIKASRDRQCNGKLAIYRKSLKLRWEDGKWVVKGSLIQSENASE